MKKLLVAALLGGFAFMAAPLASAKEVGVAVRYRDLDLSSISDAQTMIKRVQQAARRACRMNRNTQSEWAGYKACRRAAADDAIASLAHPVVTAIYTGRRPPEIRFAAR